MNYGEAPIDHLGRDEKVTSVSVLVREYELELAQVGATVRVRIWHDAYRDRDPFRFEASHFLHTPVQIGPYLTSNPWAANEAAALRRAVDTLTMQIGGAVRGGHQPSRDWLVRNESF